MNPRLRRFGVLLAVLLVPMFARPAAAAEAAGDDAAILPYLDEGTFVVLRLDTDRIDQEALGKYAEKSFEAIIGRIGIPANQQANVKGQMMAQVGTVKAWLTDMAAAGGKHIYVLFDTADFTNGNDEPAIVIPLGAGADAEKVREVLARSAQAADNVAEVGKAIVFARREQSERLKGRIAAAKPLDLPDFGRAMTAAGPDAPVRIALIPGESARKWVEEKLPQLPELLGGGETKLLSRGVRFASIGIAQKPDTLAKLTIRCQDADKAKAMLEILNKGATFLKAQTPAAEDADKQAEAGQPKLAGDTITVSVDPTAVQMAAMNIQMAAQGAPANANAGKAQPAKKDDGGL